MKTKPEQLKCILQVIDAPAAGGNADCALVGLQAPENQDHFCAHGTEHTWFPVWHSAEGETENYSHQGVAFKY